MPHSPSRIVVAVAAAGLALALAGCGGGSDDAKNTDTASSTPAPSGEITVKVVDGDTGNPVSKATVKAVGTGAATPLQAAADGTVAAPKGTVRVRATAPGYSLGTSKAVASPTTVRIYNQSTQSPQYGGNAARTRYVPAVKLAPPKGKPAWTFDAKRLIEFPPAVSNGIAVVGTNAGRVYGLDAATGTQRWTRKTKSYIAATPALAGRRAYVASMDGTLTAFAAASGRRIFQFSTDGSPIESSPLIVDDAVYFGAWNGGLYAVNLRNGKQRWRFQAADEIKGSAALAGERVVVGDYSGNVYALNAKTGVQAWRYSGGVKFYGGPGISEGKVVIGDVGGAVICLDAATGRELWRHSTGGAYVYSSPAIANGTVFIGSYSGSFQALDLDSGAVKWSFDVGGRISGSATVVGDVVYTSVLAQKGAPKKTFGLDVRTGAVRFESDDGRYSPAVGSGNTLYLVGTRTLYAFPASP